MKAAVCLVPLLFLSACASSQPTTLDARLAMAPPEKAGQLLVSACLKEADWPLYNSAAYRGGGARVRQQVLNMSSPEVRQVRGLCYQMSKASGVQKPALLNDCLTAVQNRRLRFGEKATDHVRQMTEICNRLSA